MTLPSRAPALEFDPFDAAVGSALVTGTLSLLQPFLVFVTGTLAALAVAAGVSRLRRTGGGFAPLGTARRWISWAALGVAAGVFVLAPATLGRVRGIALSVGLLGLWIGERRRATGAATAPEAS